MAKQQSIRQNQQYLYGNAAPKMETAREYNQRRGKTPETSSARAVRKNREKAQSMDRGYVVFLCMATALVFITCAVYISLQAKANEKMNNITALESKIVDLKTDNDTTDKKLQTSANLNKVRRTAMKELGMVYPSREQIVYYEVQRSDYMEQLHEIPKSSRNTIFEWIFR